MISDVFAAYRALTDTFAGKRGNSFSLRIRPVLCSFRELKFHLPILQYQFCGERFAGFGCKTGDNVSASVQQQVLCHLEGDRFAADDLIDLKCTALLISFAAVRILVFSDTFSAKRAFTDLIAEIPDILRRRAVIAAKLKDLFDFGFCKGYGLIDRHCGMIDFFQSLAQRTGFVFIHNDPHALQRFNKEYTVRKDLIDIFFQCNILAFDRVINDAGSGCLCTEFQTFKNCLVVVIVGCGRLVFTERIFQVIIQGFDGIVLRRRRHLFRRLKQNVNAISLVKVRKYFSRLERIVIFCPSGLE